MMRVIEIFHSIQGESTLAGLPTTFVRFARCDLRCTWCDTPYSFGAGTEMSRDAVLRAVAEAGLGRVCLTGGEPLLQEELPGLCEELLAEVERARRREPFERRKILLGMLKACEKRPVSMEQLEGITADIERRLVETFDREVSSKYIGQLVMDALAGLDQVAYVRFASVYREFKDVEQFLEELRPLLQRAEESGRR